MLHPSYTDLMEVVNHDAESGETMAVNSRYSIVMATARRARQLIDGDIPLVRDSLDKKPLSIAVEELEEGKLHLLNSQTAEEEEEAFPAAPTSIAWAIDSDDEDLDEEEKDPDAEEEDDSPYEREEDGYGKHGDLDVISDLETDTDDTDE